jgi:phage tail-like protein
MPQVFGQGDGLTAHIYQVEIDGMTMAQFQDISPITVERQVIEHRYTTPGGQEGINKLPGPIKFGDITLKRAVTDNDDLYNWIMEVMEGSVDAARRNGSIVEYDTNFGEVKRWNFVNGWPSKFEGAAHKANSNEVSVESLTITVEEIKKG